VTHPIDELFDALAMVAPYPPGVLPIPARLARTGFFPGGSGLWQEGSTGLPPLPIGGVMILGHNLDSERGFAQSVARGGENLNGATWRALVNFLQQALPGESPLRRCFFTNLLIGLIPGSSATGAFPGTKDSEFVERCRRFLTRQMEVVRPSLLLVLGAHTPRLLAPLSSALSHWATATTFADIDRDDGGLIPDARIAGVDLSVVALTHPSYRRMNVHCRTFRGLTGEDAELEMVRQALSSGPSASANVGDNGAG
jgi:hypothetical protein